MENLEKRPSSEVSTFVDYGAHAGKGYENQTQEDVAFPFLTLLQGGEKGMEDVPDRKPGLLFNTITRALYPQVEFVPGTTEHCFVEWVPRTKGGGFVAVHRLDSAVVVAAKKDAQERGLPFGEYHAANGNDLVETFYMYGTLCADGAPTSPAVVAYTSTKIKVYKAYNTRLQTFQLRGPQGQKITPPLYAHRILIGSILQRNAAGQEYYNFTLAGAGGGLAESLLLPDDPRFLAAQEVGTLVASGRGRVAYDTAPQEHTEDAGQI
jgi:hypothetical protein